MTSPHSSAGSSQTKDGTRSDRAERRVRHDWRGSTKSLGLLAAAIVVATVVVFLVNTPARAAGTYYVDNSCSTNGDGLAAGCAASAGASGAFNDFMRAPGVGGNACAPGDLVKIK
jgi:hypothetical protein